MALFSRINVFEDKLVYFLLILLFRKIIILILLFRKIIILILLFRKIIIIVILPILIVPALFLFSIHPNKLINQQLTAKLPYFSTIDIDF
jgi:hypothetical protein